MAVETPLEAPAEYRDVEPAHFSGGMRGVHDGGAIRSRLATLGNFLIGVIALFRRCRTVESLSNRTDPASRACIEESTARRLTGSKEYRVCGQFDGVLLRNVRRDCRTGRRHRVQALTNR